MAELEGIDTKTLRAIVAGDVDAMPRDAALGYRFAKATLAHDLLETDSLRAEIERRWGKAAAVGAASRQPASSAARAALASAGSKLLGVALRFTLVT